MTVARPAPPVAPVRRRGRLTLLVVGLGALIVLGAAVHLTQGTASTNAWDVLRLMFGASADGTEAIVIESRLPRLLAAVFVGVALGASGAVLQSVARNIMAAPDTLAVDAGAHLAVVAVAAFGVSLPLLGATGIAFVGGLAAAMVVLALSGTGGTGIVRLVLAGTALALAMTSLTYILLLLFSQETGACSRGAPVRWTRTGSAGCGRSRRSSASRWCCCWRWPAASTWCTWATTTRGRSVSTWDGSGRRRSCSRCCWRRPPSRSPVRSGSSGSPPPRWSVCSPVPCRGCTGTRHSSRCQPRRGSRC